MLPKRSIAYKLWISQLTSGEYIQDENASYLDFNGLHITRVNLLATITSININDNYAYAALDDGSASIRLKVWQQDTQLLSGFSAGDLIILIGRVREYNNERYIVPSFVKKIDNPNWLLVRQLELLKLYPGYKNEDKSLQYEESIEEQPAVKPPINIRQKVLAAIDKIDSQDGVSIDSISSYSKLARKEVENAISELIKEGEVYEYKPGRLKLLQ